MSDPSTAKLPLPDFLKILTSHSVAASKAMAIAGKIYKQYNTPAAFSELNDFKLKAAGLEDKEDRKLTLSAVRKAGYKPSPATPKRSASSRSAAADAGPSTVSQPDVSTAPSAVRTSEAAAARPRKKRKRDEDRNEFLPDRPRDELEEQAVGSLDFNEVLDEEVLRTKFVVVNRAPIMMAWAFVVAERLGFQREEALSIASVYTEMNAISKGVSLGLYDEKKDGIEASRGGSQPYVDLMGRRPLYQTANSSWRALSTGNPVAPASAYSYVTRSLRQTAPNVVGAMRLLAQSFTPDYLNKYGYGLYTSFRPEVSGWGGRGEIRCAKILDLRSRGPSTSIQNTAREDVPVKVEDAVKAEDTVDAVVRATADKEDEPEAKRSRGMTLEEYEAAIDDDDTFAQVDLDFRDPPQDQQ